MTAQEIAVEYPHHRVRNMDKSLDCSNQWSAIQDREEVFGVDEVLYVSGAGGRRSFTTFG